MSGPYVWQKGVVGFILYLWIGTPLFGSAPKNNVYLTKGDSDSMPVRWEEAYKPLILVPDPGRLEQGEVLGESYPKEEGTLVAQTVGLIPAAPEACYRVVTNYAQYRKTMPFTAESQVVRRFFLTGEGPPREVVDFWTRVRVLGFDSRYLIRIVHLPEPEKQRFRTFWTLVDYPEGVPACRDGQNRPCRNDLTLNLGSHLFEPYGGNPKWTLHTYTLEISAEGRLRRSALRWIGVSSMKEVTRAIKRILEKRDLPASGIEGKSRWEG